MPSFEDSVKGQASTTNVTTTTNGYWHSLPARDVATRLVTDVDKGLTTQEVRARRQKYGHNVIPNVEQRSTVQILLLQFKNLPIILLLTASLLSYFLGRTRSYCHFCRGIYDSRFWFLYGKEC